MVAAGETIIAGKVSGERIATAIETSNSAGITTTETVVMTVIAPVVIGRIYKVVLAAGIRSSVAADTANGRIREDNLTGTQLTVRRVNIAAGGAVFHWALEAEYTADATEDKTFVATMHRASGSGTILVEAGATFPSYLYVDFTR
jgi:hypothetical protein